MALFAVISLVVCFQIASKVNPMMIFGIPIVLKTNTFGIRIDEE